MSSHHLPGLCRHCSRCRVLQSRRLCWHCYQTDAIRRLYLPVRRKSVGEEAPQGIAEPMDALPGTPERVAVLVARAAAGQALWHPHDACRNLN
jgi:hypothetical protein